MQRGPAHGGTLLVESRADASVGARQRREPVAQRAQIQQRAADQERHAAARGYLANRGGRFAREAARRIGLGRIADVDEVMRHAPAHLGRRLRGADVEPAIHHRRIHAHDLDRQLRSEV